MAKFLCIENVGIAPLEAWTMFGVSSARGKADKIGQFGSGAKHAISVCLRNGINPIVHIGQSKIVFDCVKKMMGETAYDQVVADINGERRELSFAIQFGELDWDNMTMALREFYSNAIDQGGLNAFVTDSVEGVTDKTRVYVELNDVVERAYKDMPNVFLHLQDKQSETIIRKAELSPLKLYRKGVLVFTGSAKQLSLNDYNLPEIKLDESRNLHAWMVDSYVASAVSKDAGTMETVLLNVISNKHSVETKVQPLYYPGMPLKAAFEKLYGKRKICLPEVLQYVKNKTDAIAVPAEWFTRLKDIGIEVAELNGSKKGAERGYVNAKLQRGHITAVKKVWRKLEKIGMTNNKPMPEVEGFATMMDNGSIVHGYYEDGKIYLNANTFSMATIVEELAHYITGASDCTRDFQDFAFEVAGRMM